MKTMLLVSALFLSLAACPFELEAQWVQQNSGIDSVLTDVVMIDSMTAYAVSHGRSILRTTNRGDTWLDLTAPLSYVMPWNAVAFYDSANGMTVGDHGAVFTIKGGNMSGWCRYILYGPNCLSVLYTTPASIYVGTDSGRIYHSLDSGRTWSSEKISEWPIRSIATTRSLLDTGQLFALTPYSICSKIEFPSFAWAETVIPALQGLGTAAYDLAFTNQGTGFIVGVGGDLWASPLILRKRPSDTSWVMVPSGIPGGGPLYGVSAPSANVVYACGVGSSIVKSTDGGDTWTQTQNSRSYTVVPLPALRAISFIDDEHGFAVGESGTILYTSNGGLTNIDSHEPNAPTNFVLEQNYPNPFNPTTVISYKLSAVSNVTLKVFDLLGREVITLVDGERQPPGQYSLRWDGTNRQGHRVSSGMYYYQLATESGRGTKKAVYMK